MSYHPPSHSLVSTNGIWESRDIAEISYPQEAADACYSIEEKSWWFRHRNNILLDCLRRTPPEGIMYDIGGGNGYQAHAFEKSGYDTALVEPGMGAINALNRGLPRIIQSSLFEAQFLSESIHSIGIFDVLEHIENSSDFLSEIARVLVPRGQLYLTVPAMPFLWSNEDVEAGHYRRYTRKTLVAALSEAGFHVENSCYFFKWAVIPIAFLRALPSRLGRRQNATLQASGSSLEKRMNATHSLPRFIAPITDFLNKRERGQLNAGKSPKFGSSLLTVARKSSP